jgi:hypothetical protein
METAGRGSVCSEVGECLGIERKRVRESVGEKKKSNSLSVEDNEENGKHI